MCACIEKTGVKEWGIRALVECIELSLEGTSHQKSSFLSVAIAKLPTVGHRNLRPQDGITFNWMAFKRNIREFIPAINNPNDLLLDAPRPPLQLVFKVNEQFKPSKFDSKISWRCMSSTLFPSRQSLVQMICMNKFKHYVTQGNLNVKLVVVNRSFCRIIVQNYFQLL